MRWLKLLFVGIVASLIYGLNTSWNIGSSSIPPLGKILDPFNGFWQNGEIDMESDQVLHLSSLIGEVKIQYDSLLIPHIQATNDKDLYFAQGYITAQNRLWQMEFQTHAAAGRISEIIGSKALEFDRTQRRLGMVFAAYNALQMMDQDSISRTMVNAYTDGVNAYIQSLTYKTYPLEYKLLDYAPEPWTPLKCALLLKSMAKTLNMGAKDVKMTNALKLFGPDMLQILYPDWEGVGNPIIDNPGRWNFQPVSIPDSIPLSTPELAYFHGPKTQPGVGSNNWALNGSKTSTGSPMLCNDPHLTLSLPSIWYAMQMTAPQVNVMGVTLPGAPGVIIGFNDSIAWGVTNAQRDLVDFYKIQFQDEKKVNYLSDGEWVPAKRVTEKFIIKEEEDFYDTVIYTHHGPVTYEDSFQPDHAKEKANYAFRWIAHDPSQEIITFYLLNRARSFSDFKNALRYFSSPAQNFVFASVQNDIGLHIQGKFPVRRQNEGKFILDGSNTNHEWQDFIPYEQQVAIKNPQRNFVSSANQYPADRTYPYYITANSYEAYRNRRINERLSKMSQCTVADMMSLQSDVYNLKAAESLPYWLSLLDSTSFSDTEQKAYQLFKEWDFENTITSQAASYYEAWWDALYPLVWDEMSNQQIDLKLPTTYITIKLLREQPNFIFFDNPDTPEVETAQDVIQKSFSKGVQQVNEWIKDHDNKPPRWADYKDTFIGHLLMGLPALSYHVQHGGNHDIVNASDRTHGPSWRMVVSLEKNGVKAWGVYPGGQSGNPGSSFYNNLLARWADSQYYRLSFIPASENNLPSPLQTLFFKPIEP